MPPTLSHGRNRSAFDVFRNNRSNTHVQHISKREQTYFQDVNNRKPIRVKEFLKI